MGNATIATGGAPAATITTSGAQAAPVTIRPDEAAHFGALAGDWWNPRGSSAMLHRLNPVRLAFLRAAIERHWQGDSRARTPLAGKRALDVGCGAGLLAEPLSRLGAAVTGVDAADATIAAARAHAEASGLAIAYHRGELGDLALGRFDLVTAMEVIEHVADKHAFAAMLAASLAPGGLLVLSTPNRTLRSRLLLVGLGEALGTVPRGTHRWVDFVTPEELRTLLAGVGLTMGEPSGIAWSPVRGLHLSDDLALNYIVPVTRV